MSDDGNVIVTTQDMYREIVGMRGDLQRVITKLDDVREDTKDHETRLRVIESLVPKVVTKDALEDALQSKANHGAQLWLVVAAIVSAAVAVVALVIHR